MQKLPLLRFRICAWLCRTNGTWSVNDGRPKGLPYSIKNCLCRTVGEGLAPPAAYRKSFVIGGPASVRPLRKIRDVSFRRGGTLGRPGTAR